VESTGRNTISLALSLAYSLSYTYIIAETWTRSLNIFHSGNCNRTKDDDDDDDDVDNHPKLKTVK